MKQKVPPTVLIVSKSKGHCAFSEGENCHWEPNTNTHPLNIVLISPILPSSVTDWCQVSAGHLGGTASVNLRVQLFSKTVKISLGKRKS